LFNNFVKKITLHVKMITLNLLLSYIVPVAKTEKALAEGKSKYNQVCAGCHGFTGKGDGEKIKNLANIKPVSLVDERVVKETDGEHFYKNKIWSRQKP
jgi:mono/diheme cytochrome c family protein